MAKLQHSIRVPGHRNVIDCRSKRHRQYADGLVPKTRRVLPLLTRIRRWITGTA